MSDRRKRVLDVLEEHGKLATSKIVKLAHINFYKAKEILKDLVEEGVVSKNEEYNAIYWCFEDGEKD